MKELLLSNILVLLVSFSSVANAADYKAAAEKLVADKISVWLNSAEVTDAVKAQNEKHAALSEEEIIALDQKWRDGDEALINSVLNNDLSAYLSTVKENGQGMYTEIFIMDNKGLNVGQSDKTSDYWPGDEAKWQETYQAGAGSLHLSEIEEDESTQTFQMQISVPVLDGDNVIGAVTVGVNAEYLE